MPTIFLLLAMVLALPAQATVALYVVPNAVYVSNTSINGIPVGDDTTGNGLPNTPYLTLDKGITVGMSLGLPVICNDGAYTPAGGFYNITASLTIKGVTANGCHPTGVAANNYLFLVASSQTLTLVDILADSNSNNLEVVNLLGTAALNMTRGQITGSTQFGVIGINGSITETGTACSLTTAHACYYLSSAVNTGSIALHGGSATVSAQDNASYGAAATIYNTTGTPTLTVDGAFSYSITANATNAVRNVFLTQSTLVSLTGMSGAIHATAGQGSCNIINVSYGTGGGAVAGGTIHANTGTHDCADGGHAVLVGADNDVTFPSPPILNGVASSNNTWTVTATAQASGTHGIEFGGGSSGGSSTADQIIGSALSFICKATVAPATVFSAGYTSDATAEVWYQKSAQSCEFWNMTADIPAGHRPIGLVASSPDMGALTPAHLVAHNLVVRYQGTGGTMAQIDDPTWFDSLGNNDYYSVVNGACPWKVSSVCKSTLSAYAAASGETNSLSVDPLFVSTSDHSLQATSPLKTAGTTVPVSVVNDITGYPFASPPSIGAYQWH